MTDDSYHMPILIGIGIRISISKIFSSVFGIESIGKKWYQSTFSIKHKYTLLVEPCGIRNILQNNYSTSLMTI